MHNDAGLPPPPLLSELVSRHDISLFLDFDGTLIDLAAMPDQIFIPSDLVGQLHRLNDRLDGRLAIVTGRPLAALDGFLGPNHIKAVGSHGGEYRGAPPPPPPLSEASLQRVDRLHHAIPALFIEHKPYGLAVHYRQEPDAASSVYNMMEQIAESERLVVKLGKMLVEIGPADADKGRAVRTLMGTAPFHGSTPYFVGDDVTDEDGFHAVTRARGHGILVGLQRVTAATYHLPAPTDVLRWIAL